MFELGEQRLHRLRCIRHVVNAAIQGLVQHLPRTFWAHRPQERLIDKPLGYRIAGVQQPGILGCHPVVGQKVEAGEAFDAGSDSSRPSGAIGLGPTKRTGNRHDWLLGTEPDDSHAQPNLNRAAHTVPAVSAHATGSSVISGSTNSVDRPDLPSVEVLHTARPDHRRGVPDERTNRRTRRPGAG